MNPNQTTPHFFFNHMFLFRSQGLYTTPWKGLVPTLCTIRSNAGLPPRAYERTLGGGNLLFSSRGVRWGYHLEPSTTLPQAI